MISRAVKLTPLADIEQLSQRVIRILGQNPSPMTLLGTNSYLIGTGEHRVLLDTSSPETPRYLDLLQTALASAKAKIRTILITHHHYDHVGMVAAVLARDGLIIPNADIYKVLKKSDDSKVYDFQFKELDLSKDIIVEGATLKPIATPGHSDDHVSFLLAEEDAVFIGDAILGEGSTTFEDLHDYMKSLRHVATFKPSKLYPGHGPSIDDGEARIAQYIAHREARERQIVEFLAKQQNGKPITVRQICEAIYPDIPADHPILFAAGENVHLHLEKLLKDGRVQRIGSTDDVMDETWTLLRNTSDNVSPKL